MPCPWRQSCPSCWHDSCTEVSFFVDTDALIDWCSYRRRNGQRVGGSGRFGAGSGNGVCHGEAGKGGGEDDDALELHGGCWDLMR